MAGRTSLLIGGWKMVGEQYRSSSGSGRWRAEHRYNSSPPSLGGVARSAGVVKYHTNRSSMLVASANSTSAKIFLSRLPGVRWASRAPTGAINMLAAAMAATAGR